MARQRSSHERPCGSTFTSYKADRHYCQRVALPDGATPGGYRIWNEGGFLIDAGGYNTSVGVPYRVSLPRRNECENLSVIWCSGETEAVSTMWRMEPGKMCQGEAMSIAAALALRDSGALHNVDVAELRAAILQYSGVLSVL